LDCWICEESSKSSEEGEREWAYYLYRDRLAAYGYVLDLWREFQIQRRRGERICVEFLS
jgi:hypothetical protein